MKTSQTWSLLTAAILAALPVHSRILDDFNDNTKTAWKDFTFQPGAGTITETGGQFRIDVPAIGQPLFAASTLTKNPLELKDARTIELRADMVSGNGKDSFAVLSWIPDTHPVSSLAGYSIAKSETDILVVKGLNKYFYNVNPTPPLKNENVVLSLTLTGAGANVLITARVLDKDRNEAVIFEKSFIDTPAADVFANGTDSPAAPFLGTGHAVLIGYADYAAGGPSVYSVTFDNLEAFVNDRVLVDDFDDNRKSDWKDFTFQPGAGMVTEAQGRFTIDVPAIGQPLFAASTKTARSFDVVDGERLTVQVDMVSGLGKDSFAVLSWIPSANPVSSLAGYSLAKSETDILVVKGLNKYFYNVNPLPPLKNENVTLELSLIGAGKNVHLRARVLDKDAANAVIFEQSFTDTPAADVFANGTDSPSAPYFGSGSFVLIGYADFAAGGPNPYSVVFDNAVAWTAPASGNTPPTITDVQPEEFANFVSAAGKVRFRVSDDKPLPESGFALVLNGVRHTVGNGLTLSGSATSRTVEFSGLSPGQLYRGEIAATDADGALQRVALDFDTFSPENLVIEVEDYNFGGGQYHDNPSVVPGAANSYRDATGVPNIDFFDTRSSGNFPYRQGEPVGTKVSLDAIRAKFAAAGGADAGVFDYDIGQIERGEFLQYTRRFPTGTYEVYLRESLFNVSLAEAVLERVQGPASQENPATTILGSFLGTSSGTKHRTVPLTDALGQSKVVVRLSGEVTLRLRQLTSEPADGDIFQNYLLFVPVADAGLQRAAVAQVSPADGATVNTTAPLIMVSLKDRDTQVRANSVRLFVHDVAVSARINAVAGGIDVVHTLTSLPAPGSRVRVRMVFADSEGVEQTNDWSFFVHYAALSAANVRSGGSNPGFRVRVVQAPQGSSLENSLLRAEEQLVQGSKIAAHLDTSVVAPAINFSQNGPDTADGSFPGDQAIPGVNIDENGTDDIAMEVLTYLELPAGIVRMGAHCDDGYQIVSGSSFADRQTLPLEFHNGGPANETFEIVVPLAGLYPFRMVWYERGGNAHVEWFSLDPSSGERVLINDSRPGAIKAYTEVAASPSVVLESAAELGAAFTADASAVLNTASQTISIPKRDSRRFFRLRYGGSSPKARLEILSTTVTAETLTPKYNLAEAILQ